MVYLNNAKPHLFSEENTNIGDKSHFTVLGKFTFLNFHREIILFPRALSLLSSQLKVYISPPSGSEVPWLPFSNYLSTSKNVLTAAGVAKGVEPAPGSLLPLNGVGRAYGRQNVP